MKVLRMATKWRLLAAAALCGLIGWAAYVWRTSIPDDVARVVVIREANALRYRLTEARVSLACDHRPFSTADAADAHVPWTLRKAAWRLRERWESDGGSAGGHDAGVAFLLAGEPQPAAVVLGRVLQQVTGRFDSLAAVRACPDPALLTDFSAALLQSSPSTRNLVLALEAADRAWQLARTPAAAWNRAMAAGRMGLPAAAARSWREAAGAETEPAWRREADQRWQSASRVAAEPLRRSPELYFHRDLIALAIAGDSLVDPLPGDHLASDTAASLARLGKRDRERARTAMREYTRGRDAFDADDLETACVTFAAAERELQALDLPLVLLVRDQRIRCQCSQAQPDCQQSIHQFRAELVAAKRYPWLAARAAYAEGQTFYRRGRVYEAADWFGQARSEFGLLHDSASEGVAHSTLANAYAMAGETDAAFSHYLQAIRGRWILAGDRRRIQLEDAMMFMLRHDAVATAELLLDELVTLPATDGGRVMEGTLRAVISVRRGDPTAGERHFQQAHQLLSAMNEPDTSAELRRSLAIAEVGCGLPSSRPILAEIEASVAVDQKDEISIWLPQLLTERGTALEAQNATARAESDYLRAISILERREPRIDQTVLTLGTGSERESPFDRLIRLDLRQGRIAAALSVAQRSMSLRISALHARGSGVRDVFRAAREPAGEPRDLQNLLRPGQVAVSQILLRDTLVTWIVTGHEIRAVRRSVRARELIDEVEDLRACAASAKCREGRRVDRVAHLLLRDWIDLIPRGATLWIQPPAELQAVPFAMLTTRQGERLLARNPIATAPSFRAFVHAAGMDAKRAASVSAYFAAAAHPRGLEPLPGARSEVLRASRFYGSPVVDERAERDRFLERAGAFSIVHFAGHVLVNDEQPLLSALAFDGESGRLYVHELDERSFASARLVVLSGCDTGRSPRPTMSVANALLSQNVPSVVYTLWPVDDEAAERFAVAFHRELAAGKPRAEALQHAALSLMRRSPDKPEDWAAFALAGISGPLTDVRKGDAP